MPASMLRRPNAHARVKRGVTGWAALPIAFMVLAASPAFADPSSAPVTTTPTPLIPGYLTRDAAPDMTAVLPQPPKPGSGADADDRAAYLATRPLKGSPRWSLATSDAIQMPEAAFLDFACSLGVTLDDARAPSLQTLFSRIQTDARLFVDPPKDHFARRRPYLDQPGDICVPRTPLLDASPSYPSGHATLSWAWGLILAELAPDRSTQILSRARAYAESRVVCGVHYPSDIEAGRTNGSAMVATLHANAAFNADLDKARAEVVAARQEGGGVVPDPAQCQLETDAETHRPW